MADETKERGLAPIDNEGGLDIRPPAVIDPTQGGGMVWCSLIPNTDLDRVNVQAALQGAIPKLASIINQTILVNNVARQRVELVNRETGEVKQAVRTILFTKDGKQYSAVSDGVSQSLGMLFTLWSWPPWEPALPLVLRSLDRPGGRRFHYLEVDKDALTKKGNLK